MYYFRPSMPKFFIKTYGCQMNERDSEQVAHSLVARGYERVAHETEADVVLLNTCSVRDMADQKALGKMGMLGRIAKERPHVVFGFLGCIAQPFHRRNRARSTRSGGAWREGNHSARANRELVWSSRISED